MKKKKLTPQEIWKKFQSGVDFKNSIGLYGTVKTNENYFIGDQWAGVKSNGLPTPQFNIMKQTTMHQVSNITSDNISLKAFPLPSTSEMSDAEIDEITSILSDQFDAIMTRNNIPSKVKEFTRNAAVDGDACLYHYFDPTIRNRHRVKGEIVTEVVENTRVYFGNPNTRNVQAQPWIILQRRLQLEEAKYQAEKAGLNPDDIMPDSDTFQNEMDQHGGDRVTVLLYFYKDRGTKKVWYAESTEKIMLKEPVDTGYYLYPINWLCWDYIQDSYHGRALITSLIPNQNFINKIYAMVGVSLISSAFPKVLFDKTRLTGGWDASVGTAIAVNGNVDNVAKILEGAALNPQIAQFLQLSMSETKNLLGASDVALGNSRPDNTSAIIALQRAASTPIELTKQNLYQCLEDAGAVWVDMMRAKYGTRTVQVPMKMDEPGMQPLGMRLPKQKVPVEFDFGERLKDIDMSINHEAGASSYWSEIASMQTLDNLLMQGQITLAQYLERVPPEYVSQRDKLLDEIKGTGSIPGGAGTINMPQDINNIPVEPGRGNGALQQALNRMGA